jgi:homopolymeric O-antigen transport system ATP-binding protein
VGAPAVVFDHVWKKFRRGERHDTLRDLIPATARRLLRRSKKKDELQNDQEFWALNDVSFEVAPGEALGIIGPNGAGKSTTLKVLTRILRPNRGTSLVRGRVGALIEVAAGFHPDLTGRENVFLQGAIMGMTRADISRKLDEIVEFAGVSEFIDTPVKRYSSGMNARLGFSIAAHLEPQVLIVDEVLSVGDVAFQTKCVERMRAFKQQGVTIVFVSHNLQAVSELCDRTLFIRREVVALGETGEVLKTYVAFAGQAQSSADEVSVSAAFVGRGSSVNVTPGEKLRLRANFRAAKDVTDITFTFIVRRSTDLLMVYDGNIHGRDLGVETLPRGEDVTIDFEFTANFVRGQYHLECHAYHNPTQAFVGRLNPAGMITVVESFTHSGVADIGLRSQLVRTPKVEPIGSSREAAR